MAIERYSHVMHIVSNVEGTLKPGLDRLRRAARDVSRPGTVSGAPKVRAMEIIDELEPTRARHLRRRGRLHQRSRTTWTLAIAIRTAVREGRHALRAGRRRHRPRFGARERMAARR